MIIDAIQFAFAQPKISDALSKRDAKLNAFQHRVFLRHLPQTENFRIDLNFDYYNDGTGRPEDYFVILFWSKNGGFELHKHGPLLELKD